MHRSLSALCCGIFLAMSCGLTGADPGAGPAGPDSVLELARINLLRNASFEWDDHGTRGIRDGLAADWWLWGKGYGQYSDRSVPTLPNEGTHGARAQRIDLHASGREPLLLGQSVDGGHAGQSYTFSAEARVSDPGAFELAPQISFYAGNRHLSTKTGVWCASAQSRRCAVTGTAPEGVTQLRVGILFRPGTADTRGSVWIDARQLERSGAPGPFSAGFETGPREFRSAPIDLQGRGAPYRLSWIACQPQTTDLRFHLRSARSESALESAPWHGPADAEAYGARIETGPDLLADGSVEKEESARSMGYGDNDRRFTALLEGAREGRRMLKVEIARHRDGDGRWMVPSGTGVENDTEYAFSVWHRENSGSTAIQMSINIEDARGAMLWGRFGETREASASWKRDTLCFRTPKGGLIRRLWLQLSLRGPGWVETDAYRLRRVAGAERWAINPVHRDARWLQWRALLSTMNRSCTPRLYHVDVRCGVPQPEVRWLNVLAGDGTTQCYSFHPGQTAVFRPQVVEFTGRASIDRVELSLLDPAGRERLRTPMDPCGPPADGATTWTQSFAFPQAAPLGELQARMNVRSMLGGSCEESVPVKVRAPHRTPPRRMILGALADDYGFSRFRGPGLEDLIARYRSYPGLEIWKLSLSWKRLEPHPGRFDDEMIAGLRRFIDGARAAGAKAQIGIQQQNFPDWANDGDWDDADRYRHEPTMRLAATWTRLARALKDCAGLDSYLLINEENAVHDADAYLRAMSKVAAAVRAADPDRTHRITVRPNTRDPHLRTRIATGGSHDMDYGSGGYPTSSSWYYKEYADPRSPASCLRMAYLHDSAAAFGGPCGIGEIGFFHRAGRDRFGDEEKLAGFRRALILAYDLGMEEFQLWGTGFSFARPDLFFPRLVACRDELARRPRPAECDVRLVLDTGEGMLVTLT